MHHRRASIYKRYPSSPKIQLETAVRTNSLEQGRNTYMENKAKRCRKEYRIGRSSRRTKPLEVYD
jgi:hypothetical protein